MASSFSKTKQKTDILYDWDTDNSTSKMWRGHGMAESCYTRKNTNYFSTLVTEMVYLIAKFLYFIVFPFFTIIRYLEELRILFTEFVYKDILNDQFRKPKLNNTKTKFKKDCCFRTKSTQTKEAKFIEYNRSRKEKNIYEQTEFNRKKYKIENDYATNFNPVKNVHTQTKQRSDFADSVIQSPGRDCFHPLYRERNILSKNQKRNYQNANCFNVDSTSTTFKGKSILCKDCHLIVTGQSSNKTSFVPGKAVLCSQCLMVVMGLHNKNDFGTMSVGKTVGSSSAEADNETEEEREARRRKEYFNKNSRLEKFYCTQTPAVNENMNYSCGNSDDSEEAKEYYVKSGYKRKIMHKGEEKKSKSRDLRETENKNNERFQYHRHNQPLSSSSDESQVIHQNKGIHRKSSLQQSPECYVESDYIDSGSDEFISENRKVNEQNMLISTPYQTNDPQLHYQSINNSNPYSSSTLMHSTQPDYTFHSNITPVAQLESNVFYNAPAISEQFESTVSNDNKSSLNFVSNRELSMQSEFHNTVTFMPSEQIDSRYSDNKLSQNHFPNSQPVQFGSTLNNPSSNLAGPSKYVSSTIQPSKFENTAAQLGSTFYPNTLQSAQCDTNYPSKFTVASESTLAPSVQSESMNSEEFPNSSKFVDYSDSVTPGQFKSVATSQPSNPVSTPTSSQQFKTRISSNSSTTAQAQFQSRPSLEHSFSSNSFTTPLSTVQRESRSSSGYGSSPSPIPMQPVQFKSTAFPQRPASGPRTSPRIQQAVTPSENEQFTIPRRGVLGNIHILKNHSQHNENKLDPEEKWKQLISQRNPQHQSTLNRSASTQSFDAKMTQSLEDLASIERSDESLTCNTFNENKTTSYRQSALTTLMMGAVPNSPISNQNSFKREINPSESGDFYSMGNCKYIYTRPRTFGNGTECTDSYDHDEELEGEELVVEEEEDDYDNYSDEDDDDDDDDDDNNQCQSLDQAPSVERYSFPNRGLTRTMSRTRFGY